MGAPMAARLLAGGHELVVWNRTASRAAALVEAGATLAISPAEAGRGVDVAITMLADPAALDAVLLGEQGLLAGLPAGALLVEMSTVDPTTSRRIAAAATERAIGFVDAPVSGTRAPAERGTLLVMAGGAAADVERARPLLELFGRVMHVGEVGQGAALKLVLNGLGVHMMTGLAAMLVLGAKQGLAPRLVLDAIQAGAFSSPSFSGKGERILRGDFAPDFTIDLLLKDQRLVLDEATRLGYELPTEQAIVAMLERAVAAGFGGLDLCGIVKVFEQQAGVEARG